ncbi:MAG: low specificity L-threonine aldolase [Rhodospirillaceae bacterium]|nr:low specificity L-threonine aldolase [Rhodospirillaceae bacterium]
MNFASDNTSGAAPEIAAALARANEPRHAPGYGADPLTKRLTAKFSRLFEREVAVFPVVTGTAANVLGLSLAVPPYGGIFCLDSAHVYDDECGAAELYTGGARMLPLQGQEGKLLAPDLAKALALYKPDNIHRVKASAVTITQISEFGHIYTPGEVARLAKVAHRHGLALHMDGARFANAVAALGCRPADITWRAGVDILSFGGTKNGCFGAEAVVVFDKARAASLAYRRKRGGHLLSKMRFLSAQLDAYVEKGLWLDLARHANAMMRRLAAGLARIPDIELHHTPRANLVFLNMPTAMVRALEKAGFSFYHWGNPHWHTGRLVTAFDTDAADVDRFVATAKAASAGRKPKRPMSFLPRP